MGIYGGWCVRVWNKVNRSDDYSNVLELIFQCWVGKKILIGTGGR